MRLFAILCWVCGATSPSTVELQRDDQAAQLKVLLDGREVVVYQYGAGYALPHYWPLRSPSGKLLTAQHPDPYPHHRSVWIADHIHAAGAPPVDFYHCWKNYRQAGIPESGFRHFIRHQQFAAVKSNGDSAIVEAVLRWIVNDTEPVLDEYRTLQVVALGHGEYRLDVAWELRASYGDVRFISDSVHYAWPFVRMHSQFSGTQGGTITNDQGQTGQTETNGKTALWIDYSNTIEELTEGLAVFTGPDQHRRTWLTREYGTFGPRRLDKFNGTQFTLQAGDSLSGRGAILVHRGDAESGRVAVRYQQYIEALREH